MRGLIRQPTNVISGLMFIAAGLFFYLEARNYAWGTVRRMGPGWFPSVVAMLLIGSGVMVTIMGFVGRRQPGPTFAIVPLVIVLASLGAFALLLRNAGVIVATIVLVMGSAYAYPPVRFWKMLATAVGLSIFCAIVFVRLLGLPFPIFGPWLGPLNTMFGG